MTNFKKLIASSALTFAIISTSLTALAATANKTPAHTVANITGQTVESVIAQKISTGKTYGTIAKEAGKLDQYKIESLQSKKDNLNAQVAAGTITKANADAIIKAIEENQVFCDGTGTSKIGQTSGAKFGSNGTGRGTGGASRGTGTGGGAGGGRGRAF